MNLVRAEWSRFFARRFTRIMVLVVLGILALIGLGVALSTQKPTAATVAEAERQLAFQREQNAQFRQQCEEEQRNPPTDPQQRRFGPLPPGMTCADMVNDEGLTAENFMPRVFGFRDEAPTLLMAAGGVLTLFAFAVGASFIGAEFSSGGLMNLLLWRPRRLPLLAGKLFTVLSAITTTTVVIFAA